MDQRLEKLINELRDRRRIYELNDGFKVYGTTADPLCQEAANMLEEMQKQIDELKQARSDLLWQLFPERN